MRVSVAFSSCMHFLTMSRVLDSGDKYRGTPPTANAETGANQATRRYPAEGTRIASVSALSTSMRVNPDSPTMTGPGCPIADRAPDATNQKPGATGRPQRLHHHG